MNSVGEWVARVSLGLSLPCGASVPPITLIVGETSFSRS